MDNAELKQLLIDATVGRVYARPGIPPNKAVTSYIKAGIQFVENPDGSPQLSTISTVATRNQYTRTRRGENVRGMERIYFLATAFHT